MTIFYFFITAATLLTPSTANPFFQNHEASHAHTLSNSDQHITYSGSTSFPNAEDVPFLGSRSLVNNGESFKGDTPENASLSPEHANQPLGSSNVHNGFSSDQVQGGENISVAWVDGKLLPVQDVFYLTPSEDGIPYFSEEIQPSSSIQKSTAEAMPDLYKASLDLPNVHSSNSSHELENHIDATSNKTHVNDVFPPNESAMSSIYDNDNVYSLVVAAANALPAWGASKETDSKSTIDEDMNLDQISHESSENNSEVENPKQNQISNPELLFENSSLENEVEKAIIVSDSEPTVPEKESNQNIPSGPSKPIQSSSAVESTINISPPVMQTISPSINIESSIPLLSVVENEPTPILPTSSEVPLTLFYHQFDASNVEKSTSTYSGKNTLQPFQVTSNHDVPPSTISSDPPHTPTEIETSMMDYYPSNKISSDQQHTPTEIETPMMDYYPSNKISVPQSTVNAKLVDASEVKDILYQNSVRRLLHPTAERPFESSIYSRARLYERLERLSTSNRRKQKVYIEEPTSEDQTREVKLRPVMSAAFVNPSNIAIGPTPTRCRAKKPRTILRTLVVTEDDVIGTFKDGVFKRRNLNIGTEWKSFSSTTIDRSPLSACPTIGSPRDAGLPEETVGEDGIKTKFGLVTTTAFRTVTLLTASTRAQDVVLTHTEVVIRTLVSLRTRTVRRFGAPACSGQ